MNTDLELDVLCFGAHPDDVEIGMGGTVAKYSKEGLRIGIVDLTRAELSSNGTIETRRLEAEESKEILNVFVREILDIPDRGLVKSPENIQRVIEVIRKYRPKVIFSPYENDRHPDHGACTQIVREAIFSAGIKNWQTIEHPNAHKVGKHYTYMINGFHKPHFYIDVSNCIDLKIKSLEIYKSQFESNENQVSTPLTQDYIETIIAREKTFGKEAGFVYAEGFFSESPIVLHKEWLGV